MNNDNKFINNDYYDPNYNNQQYYNNSYSYNNNRGGKKKFQVDRSMLIGIAIVLVILIFVVSIFAINKGSKEDYSDKQVEKGSVDGQPTFRDETRVIGNDKLGYVTIPGEWVILNNVISHEGIQYTDINNDYVVTLVVYENMTIDEFISLVKDSLLKKGFVNLNVDKKTSNGTDLYQLYGYSDAEKAWILVLCLPSADGGVHCIELDGPDIESEYFEIPYTFRFTKA